MILRLVEVIVGREQAERLREVVAEGSCSCLDQWTQDLTGGLCLVRLLVSADSTEQLMDRLEQEFSSTQGFRIVLLPVEASLPRPEPAEETQQEMPSAQQGEAAPARVSREELYADVTESLQVNWTYLALVVLSTIVAAVGLVRGSVAVIIGAMVIAPLLQPNVALALATTLADGELARRALRVAAAGFALALAIALVAGLILDLDPTAPEIASRTRVSLGDIVLALAAGGAGALSFTLGLSAALVGVMVAVALLPPLVVVGMLLGAAQWGAAGRGALLLVANVICINLAGVTAFLVQGVRPRSWWEADRARRATRIAMLIWLGLLAALVAAVLVAPQP
ncbi:MAG: TIGR00341 family protein [Candidatus Bipolaricaulaceae bacterium]